MQDQEAQDVVRAVEVAFGMVGEFPGGSTLAALMDQWPQLQRVCAQAMLSALLDILGDPEQGLVRRLREDERVLRLLSAAISAADDADSIAKLRTLTHVAGRGLTDDAKLDEAVNMVDILGDLQVIDVRLRLALEAGNVESETGARTDLSGLNANEVRVLFTLTGPTAHLTSDARTVLRKLVAAVPSPFRADAEAAAESTIVDHCSWGQWTLERDQRDSVSDARRPASRRWRDNLHQRSDQHVPRSSSRLVSGWEDRLTKPASRARSGAGSRSRARRSARLGRWGEPC